MKINVTGRHFELTDAVRDPATDEIERLDKFFDNIISANLVLTQEKHRIQGELSMTVARSKLIAKSSTKDALATIEMVTDKMATQLKKHKGKIRDRHQDKIAEMKAEVELDTGAEDPEL